MLPPNNDFFLLSELAVRNLWNLTNAAIGKMIFLHNRLSDNDAYEVHKGIGEIIDF